MARGRSGGRGQLFLPWGGHVGRVDSIVTRTPGGRIIKPYIEGIITAPDFRAYAREFVFYGRLHTWKDPGGGEWKTRRRPVTPEEVALHLYGARDLGVPGPWYPPYMIIDIDNRSRQEVEEIRSTLGATTDNSILEEGERKDHYNLILRPSYHENPCTAKLLVDVTKRFGITWRVEIFPQLKKTKRLPFGPHQELLDEEYRLAETWEEKFRRYRGLIPYDLSRVPRHRISLPIVLPGGGIEIGDHRTAEDLYIHGLQRPSSRHQAQYMILDLFWRANTSKRNAIYEVRKWIREKHNGFSEEVRRGTWREIDGEIQRQADYIYERRAGMAVYPDAVHNFHAGYVTKDDIVRLVKVNRGSWPRIKFWFPAIRYSNPRRYWPYINIHTDKLIEWGSRDTYLRYIQEWEGKGLAKRAESYLVGQFSKALKFTGWKLRGAENAVLYGGRAVDTLDKAVKLTFDPWEFRELLRSVGVDRRQALRRQNQVFSEGATPASGILDVGDIRVKVTKGD